MLSNFLSKLLKFNHQKFNLAKKALKFVSLNFLIFLMSPSFSLAQSLFHNLHVSEMYFWPFSPLLSFLGFPSIFVAFWALCKALGNEFEVDEARQMTDGVFSSTIELGDPKLTYCSWMRESNIDWIIQGPACAVLIINLIFLVRIMWASSSV